MPRSLSAGRRPAPLLVAAVVGLWAAGRPAPARADGLKLGISMEGMRYATPDGQDVDLFYMALTARVSRGRAALTFSVPFVGISGGSVAVEDETFAVTSGNKQPRFGLGDMAAGLDYNIIQNRERMFIVTLSTSLRIPTASTALSIGSGEYLLGAGISAVYGITRQLLAFADVREGWVGILTPAAQRIQSAELGAIYWLTDKFGVSMSVVGADYAGLVPPSLELNVGISFELLPGFMVNTGGIGGLVGSAPQEGITFGFGFEI